MTRYHFDSIYGVKKDKKGEWTRWEGTEIIKDALENVLRSLPTEMGAEIDWDQAMKAMDEGWEVLEKYKEEI